jgi:hypothetical protein
MRQGTWGAGVNEVDFVGTIERLHRCRTRFVERVQIAEEAAGRIWQGAVHVFDLDGHATASRCYAWVPHVADPTHVVMLHGERVLSPRSAVRTWLIGGSA